jgi:broad specificity phosphatase PhoE
MSSSLEHEAGTAHRPALWLVRHVAVAAEYRSLCYGRSDVPLDAEGLDETARLAVRLAALQPTRIVHSDLQRTRLLAERVAELTGAALLPEPALRERDFGDWEGQTWDAIYQASGDDMLRMLSQPDTYRPGGGETTFELRERVLKWFENLASDGQTLAVCHGGPIAALCATLEQRPLDDWPRWIPRCGETVLIRDRRVLSGAPA